MASKLQRLFPTSFELVGLIFVTILVVLLGNSRSLLDYYGLSATNAVIKQSAGDTITKGLSQIDALSFTNQVVTFLIWAVIGLLCFSVAQAIARGYREFQEEEELSSNRYIHPSTFVRAIFWRNVLINFITLIVGLVVLALLLYSFFGYVLPVGLTYTQIFLQGVSILNFGYFLLGLAVMYIGLITITIAVRFLAQRRRFLA